MILRSPKTLIGQPGRVITAFERLEPSTVKVVCWVLRGLGGGNTPWLLDRRVLHFRCAYVAPVHPELTRRFYPCQRISQQKILKKFLRLLFCKQCRMYALKAPLKVS